MRRIKMGIWATIGTALKVANVVKAVKSRRGESKGEKALAAIGALTGEMKGPDPMQLYLDNMKAREEALEADEVEEYEEIDRLMKEEEWQLDYGYTPPPASNHWHSDPEDGGTNPKAGLGALKAPMGFSPPTAIIEMETVMAGGAYKYGAYNFRDTKIDAMTYIGAIDRHFKLWQDGVDNDEESGQSHLAHIMACCALVIDSMHTNMLVDNRHKSGLVQELLATSADRYRAFTARHKGVGDDTE
jgi:hypothetical protein